MSDGARGEASGISSDSAWARPGAAATIAVIGLVATVIVQIVYPGMRAGIGLSGWMLVLVDAVVLSLPMVLAVWAAVRVAAARGFRWAVGLSQWRVTDIVIGLGVGLVARALVEVFAPSVRGAGVFSGGALGGAVDVAAILVGFAVAVLVSPVVEEVFFRGVLQRSLADALRGSDAGSAGPAGPAGVADAAEPPRDLVLDVIIGVAVIALSTAAFVALHVVPSLVAGLPVSLAVVLGTGAVGVGCGVIVYVTRRLGGALIAHATFNAIGIGMLLL
ncbi:CPBP family intramembrane glutamic endopeptidase [Microbacterium sp. C7(2022)]|uniref:CPBP family intramembrane glutamic endopeptidase n=1 Tax=Microbacterium sp. C7(2022) TaxID=2992759 RepID=UPI00237ADD2C|nr:CPBP family intramembrane glutamic endopeptidase [Microbacterium sp. C7(2022)]MDE0545406.1 CPBP family intramembrane metalloprotease [Microbacterium sp. C7(2022)]